MQPTIIFIEANTTGTGMLALEKALTLGFKPVFLTNKPARYAGLERFSDTVVECDTNDLATLHALIASLHAQPTGHLAGITTTSEFYIETVATLAQTYQLPANPPEAIRACRNKAQTRTVLEAAGIQQPRFKIVPAGTPWPTLAQYLEHVGLPCVVKPVDDSGSNEVRLCASLEEVQAQLERIWAITTNVRGQPTAATALLEEYLDAPEYSVEMFLWNTTCTWIGITEKAVTGTPFFVEQRHLFPAPLPIEIATQICTTVEQALAHLGMMLGPIHTEIKLTPAGCAIIEVNARLAGGMIPELIRLTTGIDLLEQQLRAAAGQPPQLSQSPRSVAGIQFVLPQQAGTLRSIQGIEQARTLEGIQQVNVTARPGHVVTIAQNAYHRVGSVIALGDTPAQTLERLHQAHQLIQLEF